MSSLSPYFSVETYANRAAACQPPAVQAPAQGQPDSPAFFSAKLRFIQGSFCHPRKKPGAAVPAGTVLGNNKEESDGYRHKRRIGGRTASGGTAAKALSCADRSANWEALVQRTARMLLAAALACAALRGPARAEMLEFASPQGTKSWPKLPTLTDWHQDEQVSLSRGVAFLVPDGADTPTSDVTISAEGVSRQTGPTEVSALVDRDKAAAPGAEVKQLAAVNDKDGVPFQLYEFAPAGDGHRHVVAYSEEGNYLLAFRLSATSKAAQDRAMPIFTRMIQQYAKEIPW